MCPAKESQDFEITDSIGDRFRGQMELLIHLLLLPFHYCNDRNPLIVGDILTGPYCSTAGIA